MNRNAEYSRCEFCRQPLKERVWRQLGSGEDCRRQRGLWIPPARPRVRHPNVRQVETLFDLDGDPEVEEE